MHLFQEKIFPHIKKWLFLQQGYTFCLDLGNLIKYGFFRPPNHYDINDKNVSYIPIAKAACSSFKASIFKQNFADDYSVHLLLHGKKRLSDLNPDYFVFSFIRNPFDRLVSCYESKYHKDVEIHKKHLDYNLYFMGIISKDRGFEHFIKAISWIPPRLADQHFRSQYSSLYHHGKCIADFIGKFETLETDYEPIRQKYDFAPLAHYNKSGKGNWMDYYTPKTAKMVYRKYRKDFETFGYEDEYTKLLTYLVQKEKGAF